MQGNVMVTKAGETIQTSEINVIERYIVVKGVAVRVRSVFNDKITLDKALGNIAMRKLSESKNK